MLGGEVSVRRAKKGETLISVYFGDYWRIVPINCLSIAA